MKIEKLSIFVLVMGIAAYAVLQGVSALGFLPFALTTGQTNGLLLGILAVFLAVETFKEGKISSLTKLTKDPVAMLETLLIVVTVIMAFVVATYVFVPESLKGLLGVLYIILAAMVVVEMRR